MKFLLESFCSSFLLMLFFIRNSISLNRLFSSNSFNIMPLVIVSGKPPLLLIITAQPFEEASKLVLPSGSSHLEQTTAILVFLNVSKTLLCFKKPNNFKFLCINNIDSLRSSPMTNAFHFGYLVKILTTAFPKIS